MITHFVLTVDGVLTDGRLRYDANGQSIQEFSIHDFDGLNLIRDKVSIQFITPDRKGFQIAYRRIWNDMGFPFTHVPDIESFIKAIGFEQTAFMGSRIIERTLFDKCALSFTPANAPRLVRDYSDIVLENEGGAGAVLEACQYLDARL